MKKVLMILLVAIAPALVLYVYSSVHHQTVNAQSAAGPLFSSREKLVLTRDKATGQVSGTLEKGTIAVAYVNLWSRQTVEHANALYAPTATITEIQPAILFSHCDLPYKFSIQQGKLLVSGSCSSPANWNESPIDVVVLYSK